MSNVEEKKEKTVYFVGAGFSMDAGLPSQAQIVPEITGLFKKNPKKTNEPYINIKKYFDNLHVSEQTILEDIFTLIDRAISDQEGVKTLYHEELIKAKEELIKLIRTECLKKNAADSKNSNADEDILSVAYRIIGQFKEDVPKKSDPNKYIRDFAGHIIKQCKEAKYNKTHKDKTDPVAIISTNWDTLLDEAIYNNILKNCALENNLPNNIKIKDQQTYVGPRDIERAQYEGMLDYCCYISSLGEHKILPGIEMLGLGGFNVKLIKLHGSNNWLQCSNCNRLYATFPKNEDEDIKNRKERCKHCLRNSYGKNKVPLKEQLIMPTYIKDLQNVQYKLIWQNAGIEIAEATKIVFIGYSLPEADFEIRQMLLKNIHSDTEITVVDYVNQGNIDTFKKAANALNQNKDLGSKEEYDEIIKKLDEEENKRVEGEHKKKIIKEKWKAFLCIEDTSKINFEFGGAKNYVNSIIKNKNEDNSNQIPSDEKQTVETPELA